MSKCSLKVLNEISSSPISNRYHSVTVVIKVNQRNIIKLKKLKARFSIRVVKCHTIRYSLIWISINI